jgi:hypothetical protein
MTPEDLLLQQREDIKAVMRLPEGRRFLKRMFLESFLLASTRVPGDTDQTSFNEGKRAVALRYYHEAVALDKRMAGYFGVLDDPQQLAQTEDET